MNLHNHYYLLQLIADYNFLRLYKYDMAEIDLTKVIYCQNSMRKYNQFPN